MANIREISGRIRSVQDTKKITNAMYMISSTKLRKARKNEDANDPYFQSLCSMIAYIMEHIPELECEYMDKRDDKPEDEKVHSYIVITADKGLAGAYNHNVLALAEKLMSENKNNVLYVVGEVGRQYFAGKKIHMDGQFQYTAQNPTVYRAKAIADQVIKEYLDKKVDDVTICFTSDDAGHGSEPLYMRLLPLIPDDIFGRDMTSDNVSQSELTFDPSPLEVLNNIIPDAIVGFIYSALVDSFCTEQNERMIAMDAANKNADTMIHDLSIQYNRMRQQMITQEITEVIAGAKAQKKKKLDAARREGRVL